MSPARFIRICRSATIGEHPIARTKRAMNADRLEPAFCAKAMTEGSADGRATISANARAI
jgi:hypothetical protein